MPQHSSALFSPSVHHDCHYKPVMTELYRLHQWTHTGDEAPLYAVIADHVTDLARNKARLAINAGLVQVNGQSHHDVNGTIKAESAITVDLRQGIPSKGGLKARAHGTARSKTPSGQSFAILHEDEDVVVVNKAAGVLSAPMNQQARGHVPELLRQHWRQRDVAHQYIGVVHRIDQATSGCLLFTRNKQAQTVLGVQFSTHAAERRYRALVGGQPKQDADTLDSMLGRGKDGRRCVVPSNMPGKRAVTHFTVAERFAQGAALDLRLETGRTHQIRIHCASIGCPIIGDPVYGPQGKEKPALLKASRLMLHASELHFDHPRSGERIIVRAPVPNIFNDITKQLS